MLPFALLATLLLSFQLLLPLKINKYWKLALILPIMVAAFKPEIIFFFGGDNYFAPDLPGWLILTAAWFYGVVFFSFFLPCGKLLKQGNVRRSSVLIKTDANLVI